MRRTVLFVSLYVQPVPTLVVISTVSLSVERERDQREREYKLVKVVLDIYAS